MKLPKIFFRKLLIASLLIAMSAVATILIKDSIDSKDPENSLPIIQVNAGYIMQNVQLSGFSWKFITSEVKRSPEVSPVDAKLVMATVQPNVPIVITFSDESGLENVKLSRSEGLGNGEFLLNSGEPLTPQKPGIYTYQIEANFKKGKLIYYFRVDVLEQ